MKPFLLEFTLRYCLFGSVFEPLIAVILISKYIVPKGFIGISIFPFIFLSRKELKSIPTLINHEKIHLKQQLELLLLPFYLWYVIEFFIRWIQFRNRRMAYSNISFEREAYANEGDFQYLKTRPLWGFLKYLRNQ